MGGPVEYILLLLSVVLVVSTLTGSTNNYYNEPTGNKGFTDCSVTKKFFELTNESLTPYPLTRGRRFHWKAQLHNRKTIQWGILHFTMTYNFKNYTNITFFDVKLNLCDSLDDLIHTRCPLQPGTYQMNYNAKVPNQFWPAQYKAYIATYDDKGEQTLCQTMELVIAS
ncbi:PREDICTED: phosphatidylglycerol/phosphatidylinositol transfer protein-like [Amphimedon queenslandica]|uniref:MD-2-related lipid-recognition domain-containing protein n=1 Tax=Amphimedon queenslandica TaxID=400682 RepID=A0AAN0JP00_AMPQE|nr:PREDICTED: phosphatidylglycerol/phosphatidylinositol transfer protein-like [Amphimedon queenslandica]|eukprot:XP_019858514.1 PREDICTED: phosphatidylglycerol/phosphatidylinositol transfer protein-like [Amphimedon queenslandica]